MFMGFALWEWLLIASGAIIGAAVFRKFYQ
jgi:hypothetical protein